MQEYICSVCARIGSREEIGCLVKGNVACTECFEKFDAFKRNAANLEDEFYRRSLQLTRTVELLDSHIRLFLSDSREKAIARTKLEECAMWIEKALKKRGTH